MRTAFLQRIALAKPWLGDEEVKCVHQVGIFCRALAGLQRNDFRKLPKVKVTGQDSQEVALFVLYGCAYGHGRLLQLRRVVNALDIGTALALDEIGIGISVLALLLLIGRN